MLPKVSISTTSAAVTLSAFLLVLPAHGHDDHGAVSYVGSSAVAQIGSNATTNAMASGYLEPPLTYFSYPDHEGLLMAHIVFMTLAWVIVLPIGVMLSLAHSQLLYPAQCTFLIINGLGLPFGSIYNKNTPNLYEGNVHHGLGWALTWIVVAQALFGIIRLHTYARNDSEASTEECTAFLPVSVELMAQEGSEEPGRPYLYEYPRDSGHGTEESTRCNSFSCIENEAEKEKEHLNRLNVSRTFGADAGLKRKRAKKLFSILANIIPQSASGVLYFAYDVVDRLIIILGFVAITTGVVTYGGIAKGHDIFNVLAHFIKGAIFFWYGVLTLGRWMGCYGDIGWAWNVRPTVARPWLKARFPTAEFTESFVIFLYGVSNVWLEHLEGWGHAWSATDVEHVAISILFFGGGSLGMLVESAKARDLINTTLSAYSTRRSHASTQDPKTPPRTYAISMNPVPGLTLLLLGLVMSSHRQDSMVSTKLHSQWGTLLIGFSIARAVTYILLYLSPPTSILPSRPPSELITSFCLMATGLIFMASNKNTVFAIEQFRMNAMIVFTIAVGFTTLLMAWVVVVVAVKGWAVGRREREAGAGVVVVVVVDA